MGLAVVQAASATLIDEEDPSKGTVTIRVDLASGPVTATVIGSRNPKCCTVHTHTYNTHHSTANNMQMLMHAQLCN